MKDIPESLVAARFVARNEKGQGEDGLVKMYRALQEDNPLGFLRELRGLEKDFAGVDEGTDEETNDVGTAEAVKLCEKLIQDLTANG